MAHDDSRALFQFHWRAGGRVALRANAAGLGIVIFAFGVSAPAPDPWATLRYFLLGIVSVGPTSGPRMLLAVIALGLAVTAAPRVTLGDAGWMRSLPFDSRASRRAAIAAIAVAEAFVPIVAVAACLVVSLVYRAPLSWSRILAVAPMVVAIAGFTLRRQSVSARALYVLATMAAIVGTWLALSAAIVAIVLAERFAHDVEPPPWRARIGRPSEGIEWTERSPSSLWLRASWRAIGARRAIDGFAGGVIPLAFAYFIVRNNADLASATVGQVVRVAGGVAIVVVASNMAHSILRRRRPWPWMRSLPWSSSRRIVIDAIIIGAPVLLAALVLVPLSVIDSLAMIALVPSVALAGAAAIRLGATHTYGAAGQCAVITMPVVTVVVLWPILSIVALILVPIALRWVARLEMQTGATTWAELQHDAAGDPYWLSRS